MKRIALFLLFCLPFLTMAQEVRLEHSQREYSLGSLVPVDIRVSRLEAVQNIQFDLEYNGQVLEWANWQQEGLSNIGDCQVLHAQTEDAQGRKRAIFSLLWPQGTSSYQETTIIRLYFRVKGHFENETIDFHQGRVINVSENDVTANWDIGGAISSPSGSGGHFIWIRNPQDGAVLSQGQIGLDIINSKGAFYQVLVRNDSNGFTTPLTPSPLGFLGNVEVDLQEGDNEITVLLSDQHGEVLAMDRAHYYYRNDPDALQIITPGDHSVINHNRVYIRMATAYPQVTVDGLAAESLGYLHDDQPVWGFEQWLREGFNRISIRAIGSDGSFIEQMLTLYYEKGQEHFSILTPFNGEVRKYDENAEFYFKGEISDLYDEYGNANTVSYRVVFHPINPYQDRQVLVEDGLCKIEPITDNTMTAQAAYQFSNTQPIPLQGLGDGTLEITAFKNKDGARYDDAHTVVMRLDDSVLAIELAQPQVFTQDYISNEKTLQDFHSFAVTNGPVDFDAANIRLTPQGEFILEETQSVVTQTPGSSLGAPGEPFMTAPQGLFETRSGDLIAFENSNGTARFYRLQSNASEWKLFYSNSGFYIYDVKEVDQGFLLGVSNYAMNGNSGLYLLQENTEGDYGLTNIIIGEPIVDVQFIRTQGPQVYLYGNDYSHIYRFRMDSMELEGERLRTYHAEAFPCSNSIPLKNFQISPQFQTVILHHLDGMVQVYYRNSQGGFTAKNDLDHLGLHPIERITLGDYETGDFYTWLLLNDQGELSTIMEDIHSGELRSFTVSNSPYQGTLHDFTFAEDSFRFMVEDTGVFRIYSYRIYFDQFIQSEDPVEYATTYSIPSSLIFLASRYNGYIWGNGGTGQGLLTHLLQEVEPLGDLSFSYRNPDVEGLEGFQFSVPAQWVNNQAVRINFSCYSDDLDFHSPLYLPAALEQTLEEWSEGSEHWQHYTVERDYDDRSESYRYYIIFDSLVRNPQLDFNIHYESVGNSSPVIWDFQINKKVPVKIPKSDSEYITVPIQGWVTDPTVDYIYIGDQQIALRENGAFYYDYAFATSEDSTQINLSCTNSIQETTELHFEVRSFESINAISDSVEILDTSGSPLVKSGDDYLVDSPACRVSGHYYGLVGAVVGYELIDPDNDEIIDRGILSTTIDSQFDDSRWTVDNQADLESGHFTEALIPLLPGVQQLRLFVENPGGKRSYFLEADGSYPRLNYQMAEDDQWIEILNSSIIDLNRDSAEIYQSGAILQQWDMELWDRQSAPQRFEKSLQLRGVVNSLYQVPEIRVLSSSPDVIFSNGTQEIIISTDAQNRFNLDAQIIMAEDSISQEYYLSFQPTAPFLIGLKSVLRINADKNFEGAFIIPDFNLMVQGQENPENPWTEEELRNLSKPIYLEFNRNIPSGMEMILRVNFAEEIQGRLMPDGSHPGWYYLMDDQGSPLNLIGLKPGINRVGWSLWYQSKLVSSSSQNDPNKRDAIININTGYNYADTQISFSPVHDVYYNHDNRPIPDLNYVKDSYADLTVHVNENLVLNEEGDLSGSANGSVTWNASDFEEGKNYITVISSNPIDGETIFEYSLMYDSQAPIIGTPWFKLDGNIIEEIGVLVKEENLDIAQLILIDHGVESLINQEPVIIAQGAHNYHVIWDLSSFALESNLPDRFYAIRVVDKSGKASQLPDPGNLAPGEDPGFAGPVIENQGSVLGNVHVITDAESPYFIAGSASIPAEYRNPMDGPVSFSNFWTLYRENPYLTENRLVTWDMTDGVFDFKRRGTIAIKSLDLEDQIISSNFSTHGNIEIYPGFQAVSGKNYRFFSGAANVPADYSSPILATWPTVADNWPENIINFSMNMAIRLEDSALFTTVDDSDAYYRIVTLWTDPNNSDHSFYIGYRKVYNQNRAEIVIIEADQSNYSILDTGLFLNVNEWQNLLISMELNPISRDLDKIDLYLDSSVPFSISLAAENDSRYYQDIFNAGQEFYFGDKGPNVQGHFSLAQIFYVDRTLDNSNLASYVSLLAAELTAGDDDAIQFPNTLDGITFTMDDDSEIGANYYDLRVSHSQGDGVYSVLQDRNYDQNGRALIATDPITNFIQDLGNRLYFLDCSTPVTSRLDVSHNTNDLQLVPNPGTTGRYIFGNRPSNHGLTNQNYYSFSGTITVPNADPDLEPGRLLQGRWVLSINGKEQSYPLTEGEFLNVYHHNKSEIPQSVILYLETSENINLSRDMQFVEGNARIPQDILSQPVNSFAQTWLPYRNNGTISLSYKPFNVNLHGEVDEPGTILHSEYLEIMTYYNSDLEKICYMAKIINGNGSAIIEADIAVIEGWHDLRLTWSAQESLVRFYVDGKLAGLHEGNFNFLGESMIEPFDPDLPEDNTCIGADITTRSYAHAYLDNFRFSSLFEDFQNIAVAGDPALEYENALARLQITGPEAAGSHWTLFRQDQNRYVRRGIEIDGTNIILDDEQNRSFYPPGRYLARYHGTQGNREVNEQISFIYDTVPYFQVVSAPQLLIEDQNESLDYSFYFDDSYFTQSLDEEYAAMALQIRRGDWAAGDEVETIYLSQDFLSQNKEQWIFCRATGGVLGAWNSVSEVNGILDLQSSQILVGSNPLSYAVESFYFVNDLNAAIGPMNLFSNVDAVSLPLASLTLEPVSIDLGSGKGHQEYMIKASLSGTGMASSNQGVDYSNFSLQYEVNGHSGNTGILDFPQDGSLNLYYDDILEGLPIGQLEPEVYSCQFKLFYLGSVHNTVDHNLYWQSTTESPAAASENPLNLTLQDFSLLNAEKYTGTEDFNLENPWVGTFYVEYSQSEIKNLYYSVLVYEDQNDNLRLCYEKPEEEVGTINGFLVLDDIALPPGASRVELQLYSRELVPDPNDATQLIPADIILFNESYLSVNLSSQAPQLSFTNSVPYFVTYDSMTFNWLALQDGRPSEGMEYRYNIDGRGWSSWSTQWTELSLYELEEELHELRVVARNAEKVESMEIVARFFVDTLAPSLDENKVTMREIFDSSGIVTALQFVGESGAITDSTLSSVSLNGQGINIESDGSFISPVVSVDYEGWNEFEFILLDRVNNQTTQVLEYDNSLIDILSPQNDRLLYSPFTLVGKLKDHIDQGLEIYLQDSVNPRIWHKAQINADRIFFISDVEGNPGSGLRDALTELRLKFCFESGTEFYRDISYRAGDLYRPLEISLSNRAAQGQGEPMLVEIRGECRLNNIASWSIDFNGDGLYDDIRVVDNPLDAASQVWEHRYSAIGEVTPRVRVITTQGEYFSAQESIIIHEEIKTAASTSVTGAINFDIISLPDGSEKIFLLKNEGDSYGFEVIPVLRNQAYFSNPLYSVSLRNQMEGNARGIRIIDEEHIIIWGDQNGKGFYYLFEQNDMGNWLPTERIDFDSPVVSTTLSDQYLFISEESRTGFHRLDLAVLDQAGSYMEFVPFDLDRVNVIMTPGASILYQNGTLYATDRMNQKIYEFSDQGHALNWWGELGTDDLQFIQPSLISGFGSRHFIYDLSREDIQIFDGNNQIVSTLSDNGDYLPQNFMTSLTSMEAFTREEGTRNYYYLVVLNPEVGQLSMIRLPQWEELRARTRNNQIVFLQDREIYTAKPDGSDLSKRLTTDSLPRIEGEVDYPSLSPDGRRLVFVSRKHLYNGQEGSGSGDDYAYDNLYILEIGQNEPKKVPLNSLTGYEIERPVFNSNGDRIAFSARTSGGFWQIYEYDWNTGVITKIFDALENIRFPYYSPDDRFVVYTTDYDGDEDVEIFDFENPDIRVTVTANDGRDSYPVWTRVYPYEISNQDLDIESKISFVSQRNFEKEIFYSYVARPSDGDLRIVNINGEDIGSDPDQAAEEVIAEGLETDYPSFTGDGRSLVFEGYDGSDERLYIWDINGGQAEAMELPLGATRPAGMKNSITGFTAEIVNGNEVQLNWNRYTDHDTFYILQFKQNDESLNYTEKKVYQQDGTTITGLEMGMTYLFHLCLKENDEVVAETQWMEVEIPEVVARPSYEIDSDNPYLVKLTAWTPESETDWVFSWIIDNQEIATAQNSPVFYYEFATSGTKTVQLKASNRSGDVTSISEPLRFDIYSDILPQIQYSLIGGSSPYLEVSCLESPGSRIDWSSAVWTVTGPGGTMPQILNGSQGIISVADFQHKVNINLKLSRTPVNGQQATDTIERNIVVDLDYPAIKPVLTYSSLEQNPRMITFDGSSSLGNIDWRTSRWNLYADGQMIHQEVGVSSFSYLFAESGREVPYGVSLSVADNSNGTTKTVTQQVYVETAEMEPVVDYEILELQENGQTVGVKVVLSASGSRGSNIDFNATEWNLPLAAQYGEQPKQKGPTAIFNLRNPGDMSSIDVSITLVRRGSADVATQVVTVPIDGRGVSPVELNVNPQIEETPNGYVVIFDVLNSTGPDIEWEKTEWLINGQYTSRGPSARLEIPYNTEEQRVIYSVTLHRSGGDPIIKTDSLPLDSIDIQPNISAEPMEDGDGRTWQLSVSDTQGFNIDWERTLWSIWDGADNVIQKRGGTILHTFAPRTEAMGYPVMAEMYFVGGTQPFYAYRSLDLEGNPFLPIIQYDQAIDDFGDPDGDGQVMTFSAQSSQGSGIEWSRTRWTFGDGSPAEYGAVVQHKFPLDDLAQEYKVTMTLTRRTAGGQEETETVYQTITMDGDEINPVIRATIDRNSGTLLLSAEQSEGRGLLLDRCVWIFEGEGDSESFSRSRQEVQSSSNTNSSSLSNSLNSSATLSTSTNVSVTAGTDYCKVTAGGSLSQSLTIGGSVSNSNSSSSQSGSQNSNNNNQSFSNQNTHTGPIARRYINDFDFNSYGGNELEQRGIWVTLFVYRQGMDGAIQGVSLTERININRVLDEQEVIYE